MKYLSALLCLSVIAIVSADFGHYVPKGYYTIDEDGNQSPIYFIESIPELFHRSRRQVNPGFGFPAFQFPFPQNFGFVPVGSVNQNQPNLNNRFGESGPSSSSGGVATGVATGVNTGFPFGNSGVFPGFQPLPFPAFQPGQGGNFQGTSITSVVQSKPSGGVGQRFGEENSHSGQTVVTTVNKDGKVTETVTHVRPDGSSHTTTNRGGSSSSNRG